MNEGIIRPDVSLEISSESWYYRLNFISYTIV